MMTLQILVAALAALTVFGLLLALGSLINAGDSIDDRLSSYVSAEQLPVLVQEAGAAPAADERPAVTARLNQALDGLSFSEQLKRELVLANLPLTVAEFLLLKVSAVVIPAALLLLFTRSWISLPVVILLGFFGPDLWLRQRRNRRSRLFDEQLPETLSTLISSLRGGFSLVQALENVAREAPEPTGNELRRVVQEIQLGLSVNESLSNLAARMESENLELLVAVLKIHARVGGNLTMVLENIANTIRERSRLRREIRVITSQQRFASYVLSLLPVILTLILLVVNPEYIMQLFQPGPLLTIPIVAVLLNAIGFLIIRKIVDIRV